MAHQATLRAEDLEMGLSQTPRYAYFIRSTGREIRLKFLSPPISFT